MKKIAAKTKILNPKTGRMVNSNGKVGKTLTNGTTSGSGSTVKHRKQRGGMTCADGRICNADCCPSDNFDNESWKCCPIDD